MKEKFTYNDIVTFHKIVHNLIPVSLPNSIVIGHSRTRSGTSNGDHLTYIVDENISINSQVLSHDFFIRCLNTWNLLPFSLRETTSITKFGSILTSWLWDRLTCQFDNYVDEHEYSIRPD